MNRHFVFLRVPGGPEIAIGVVNSAGEIPGLLRHVADYYDNSPDDCTALLGGAMRPTRPSFVADPFSVR